MFSVIAITAAAFNFWLLAASYFHQAPEQFFERT
jgi:hypothetical protein